MQYLWVGMGGAVGSLLRFLLQNRFEAVYTGLFPIGTLVVNLLGSLAIGFLGGIFEAIPSPTGLKNFLLVGVLGGFTTFSAFAQGNLTLIRSGHARTALLYILASNVLGIALAFAGYFLARAILRGISQA